MSIMLDAVLGSRCESQNFVYITMQALVSDDFVWYYIHLCTLHYTRRVLYVAGIIHLWLVTSCSIYFVSILLCYCRLMMSLNTGSNIFG